EIEAVGDVVQVPQDLRLRGVPFGPLPLLLELPRELVRVLHALDVTARARVAVPEPRAPEAAARLEDSRRESKAAHAVKHADAGEAGADDHRVEVGAQLGVRLLHMHIGTAYHEPARPEKGRPANHRAPATHPCCCACTPEADPRIEPSSRHRSATSGESAERPRGCRGWRW